MTKLLLLLLALMMGILFYKVNHFAPYAIGEISVADNGGQSKDFHDESPPIASLLICVVAIALSLYGGFKANYSPHFVWGVFCFLCGLGFFVYGLGGIFDYLEVTTR